VIAGVMNEKMATVSAEIVFACGYQTHPELSSYPPQFDTLAYWTTLTFGYRHHLYSFQNEGEPNPPMVFEKPFDGLFNFGI